jgi:cytochrome b561
MATRNWLAIHLSIGVTIFLIILVRLCWRFITRAPGTSDVPTLALGERACSPLPIRAYS